MLHTQNRGLEKINLNNISTAKYSKLLCETHTLYYYARRNYSTNPLQNGLYTYFPTPCDQRALRKRIKLLCKNPVSTVIVINNTSLKFDVLGKIFRPGMLKLMNVIISKK